MSLKRSLQILIFMSLLVCLLPGTAIAQKPTAAIPVDALESVRLAYLKKIFLSIVFKPETDAFFDLDPKFWSEIKSTLQKAQLTVVDEEKAEDASLRVEAFVATSSKGEKVLAVQLSLEKEFPARVGNAVLALPAQVWSRQAIVFDPENNKAQVMSEIRRMLNEFLTDRVQGHKIRRDMTSAPAASKKSPKK